MGESTRTTKKIQATPTTSTSYPSSQMSNINSQKILIIPNSKGQEGVLPIQNAFPTLGQGHQLYILKSVPGQQAVIFFTYKEFLTKRNRCYFILRV
jgi:hypothetical protein